MKTIYQIPIINPENIPQLLRFALLGYLIDETRVVWTVDIKIEIWDVYFICSQDKFKCRVYYNTASSQNLLKWIELWGQSVIADWGYQKGRDTVLI